MTAIHAKAQRCDPASVLNTAALSAGCKHAWRVHSNCDLKQDMLPPPQLQSYYIPSCLRIYMQYHIILYTAVYHNSAKWRQHWMDGPATVLQYCSEVMDQLASVRATYYIYWRHCMNGQVKYRNPLHLHNLQCSNPQSFSNNIVPILMYINCTGYLLIIK